jgi:hypothetical protein
LPKPPNGVKDEDFFKGIAQNAIQLESALSNRKRKANEMEEDSVFVGKIFGIVTDAEKCTLWNAHSTIKTGKDSSY